MVSIKDIARAAGVSHPTVSRALSNSPLVNADTKSRIQRLAREMGYSPDALARSLVSGRSRTIGVVVTTIADPFIAEVVQGIEDAAHVQGYTVILCNSHADPEREIGAVETLRSKRVDGVIVTSSRVGALYLEHLERIGVPVVLVNNHSAGSGRYTFSVSIDNQHGGYLATEHLVQLGHRRIAYITGPANNSDDLGRLTGYRHVLEESGTRFDPRLVVQGTGTVAGVETSLAHLMSLDQPPTAVFCYNDMTAIGLMRAAVAIGLTVPDDLSVVGFDDIPFASYMRPALTTVAQQKAEMGRWAVEMALELISMPEPAVGEFSDQEFEGHLVLRESTALAGS